MSDNTNLNEKDETQAKEGERYLCFTLGAEHYALPLLSVREVIAMPEITPIPQMPSYFLGIMNLRGLVISIIDLRTRLGIKPNNSTETAIIICDLNPNALGVVVDSIESVVNPAADQISEKPELQNNKNTEYISAVFRNDERLVLVLDITRTLTGTDLKAINSANKPTKAAA